jgi:hypothetical protein
MFIGHDLSTSLSAGKAQNIEAPEVNAAIGGLPPPTRPARPGIYCRDAQRALDMASAASAHDRRQRFQPGARRLGRVEGCRWRQARDAF